MKIKKIVLGLIAGSALLGGSNVMACTTEAWTGDTDLSVFSTLSNAAAGSPADGFKRYSGECSLKAEASGEFVVDGSPLAETAYKAQFYVYTGLTGGSATIFRIQGDLATNAADVVYNAGVGQLEFTANGLTSSGSSAITVLANRWYRVYVDLDFTANTLDATVRGGGSSVDATVALTGDYVADGVAYVQLGWIDTVTGDPTGTLYFDAFETRRQNDVAALPRGDANNSGSCNASDVSEIANDVVNILLGNPSTTAGQPDCDENGTMNASDVSCVASLVVDDLLNDTVCGV